MTATTFIIKYQQQNVVRSIDGNENNILPYECTANSHKMRRSVHNNMVNKSEIELYLLLQYYETCQMNQHYLWRLSVQKGRYICALCLYGKI